MSLAHICRHGPETSQYSRGPIQALVLVPLVPKRFIQQANEVTKVYKKWRLE